MDKITDRLFRILCGSFWLPRMNWGAGLRVAMALWDAADAEQKSHLLKWAATVRERPATGVDAPVTAVGCLGAIRWDKSQVPSVPLALEQVQAAVMSDGTRWANTVVSTVAGWDLSVFPSDPGQMPILYRAAFERLSRESGCLEPPQRGAGHLDALRFVASIPDGPLTEMSRQAVRDISSLNGQEFRALVEALIEMDRGKPFLCRHRVGCDVLNKLAVLRPDGLTGFHSAILNARLQCRPVVYRNAPAQVRDELIRQMREGRPTHVNTPMVLAWIGDDVSMGVAGPSAMMEVGCVRTTSRKVRRLYSEVAYELVKPVGGTPGGSVAVLADLGDYCPKCGSELVALFQFDLSDDRIASLLGGIRIDPEHETPLLTIPMCPSCIKGWKPYFAAVSTDGVFDVMEDENPKTYTPVVS